MTERLDDTVALVTGASSGIGAATAVLLAELGAAVAVAARRKERLDDLVGRIEDKGGRAVALETDELGRLDTVVNNAGVMLLGPIEGAPVEEWERMVSLNVMGVLYIARAALPHLLAAAEQPPRRVADLVNISSVAGRVARAGSGVYNTTKWGVGAFSESFRQEFTRRHVRVSLVEPGAVKTELASHVRPEVWEQLGNVFTDTELMEAEDIAEAIAFIVTRPRRVAINEVLVRPTEQER